MMKQLKIIDNEQDFAEAVRVLDELSAIDFKSASQLDTMAVISVLIDDYQRRNNAEPRFPADPIEAIEFRLDQLGKKHKYLRKFIGSPSKVSEVMKRKIGLSLQMIRSLHEGLGIPAEILLQDPRRELSSSPFLAKDYPFAEMFKRGYFAFNGTLAAAKEIAEELLTAFFSVYPQGQKLVPRYRKTAGAITDENALKAWQCHVIKKAEEESLPVYDRKSLPDNLFCAVAQQSQYQYGPQNAKELLNRVGIHLVYEPHLPMTRLDGAAFMLPDGHPVIALTLRHDRLDNYWFTLMHELHHVLNDLPQENECAFMDDTDQPCEIGGDDKQGTNIQQMEECADKAARDSLIPPEVWRSVGRSLFGVRDAGIVRNIAQQRQLSPAVLAGRVRWETQNYTLFQDLLGKCRNQLMSASAKDAREA